MSFRGIDLTIKDWIDYKPSVGVEMLTVTGLPGWGKTNVAMNLIYRCIKKGELLVIPGDRFCEWRHFTHSKRKSIKNIKLIVPENTDIKYFGKGLQKWKKKAIPINYDELEVMDLLGDDTTILVIYDAHLPIGDRAWLWVKVVDQLLNRYEHIDKAIGILFNEAGVLFPESASGDHWKAVDKFAEIIVDTRKGLVRPIFISQLQSEVRSTIRKKAMFKLFRKGWAGRTEPKPLRKHVPFLLRNEYDLSVGGLYVRENKVNVFQEIKEIYKMIPPRLLNKLRGDGQDEQSRKSVEKLQKFPVKCLLCGHEWSAYSPQPAKCVKCRKSDWNDQKVSETQTGGQK